MGIPPLAYLTNWRMLLAERDLREGMSVLEVATAVGYASESAFSHAFKRTMGVAPGRYRKTSEGGVLARPCPKIPSAPPPLCASAVCPASRATAEAQRGGGAEGILGQG